MGSHPKRISKSGDYFGNALNNMCCCSWKRSVPYRISVRSPFLPRPIEEIKLDQQLLDTRVCFGITATAAAARCIVHEQSVCFQRTVRTSASLCIFMHQMGASLIACENTVGEFLKRRSLMQLSLYLLPSRRSGGSNFHTLFFSAYHMDKDTRMKAINLNFNIMLG